MNAGMSRFIGNRGNYATALQVSADDYRLSFQLWFKRLPHGNEESMSINMEYTAGHETAYKLTFRADKANFSPEVPQQFSGLLSVTRI